MKLSTKLLATVGLSVITTLPVITPASAQIQEIVVTTRKRAESLQDAPVAVTAFTAEAIARQGIANVRELANQVPGFNLQESFGRRDERPAVRGLTTIGTPDFGVESGTAIFIDGVFVSTDTTAFGLSDLERIEFVRGPQSALYGRNAYAGAVNFITKTPGDEFEFNGTARYAENAEWEVTSRVAGPIVPGMLAGSVFIRHYEYGGEYTNPLDGDKLGDQETNSIAGALFFDSGEGITVKTRVAYWKDKDGQLARTQVERNRFVDDFGANAFFSADGRNRNTYFKGELPILPIKPSETQQLIPFITPGMERETFVSTLRADWDFYEGYTATLLAGFRTENRRLGSDVAPGLFSSLCDAGTGVVEPTCTVANVGVPFRFFSGLSSFSLRGIEFIAGDKQQVDEISFELRFTSPQEERFRWMVGGFYYNVDTTPFDIFDNRVDVDGIRETNNWATFGLIDFDVTDRLTLTLEARYAEDRKSIDGFTVDAIKKFTSFNPKGTVKFDLTDDIHLYASVAKGNKPGGFNDQNNQIASAPGGVVDFTRVIFLTGTPVATFKEETSWVYEGGAKTTWFDNRLSVNLSAFYADIEDVQLTNTFTARVETLDAMGMVIDSESTGNSQIINIDKMRSWGGEIEVQFAPTDELFLTAGYAYVKPEFRKGGTIDQENLFGDASVAGNIMPRVSQHEFNWSGEWRRPIPDYGVEFFVNVNGSYDSKRYVQVHNLATFGEAVLLNTRLGLETDHYTLAVFVKNLTDEDSYVDVMRFRDWVLGNRAFNGTLRRGRQVGVQAAVNF